MKFPIYYQLDLMDCGATCLQMIASYYGKEYSLDSLREMCYTTKEGVSLLSISDAAENIGFKTVGSRISFEQLKNEALLPCIVHWEQNHFIVVYKIKNRNSKKKAKIYIADPGKGKISYTEEEFKEKWISTKSNGTDSGIVLLLEPTNLFYKLEGNKSKAKGFNFLFSYFLKYKKYFAQISLGLLLGALLQLLFPFLTQSIVDIGITNQNIKFIYLVLIAQLVLVISRMSVEFIRRWILLHIGTRINISLLSDFFIKLMKLPMSYFDSKLTGDIMQRINDHDRVGSFITTKTLETIFSFITFIIFSIVLLIYSLKIFLIFLVGSTIYVIWIITFLKKRKELDYKYFDINSKKSSNTFQLITGMQEIKLQNCEKIKRWEWEDIQADLFKINLSSLSLSQKQEAGNILINEIKNILITIVAAMSVINGQITLGMMLAIQYIIGQLSVPIDDLVLFIYDLQDTKISLDRINEVHIKENENTNRNLKKFSSNDKSIYINDLIFQYEGPKSKKVLNISYLIIPENKITAIVGASGSGKTTLIKLLLQYYNPVSGEILVGKDDITKLDTIFWRSKCGVVMQDGYIFSDTIAKNIAISDTNININRLHYAATVANIHDFIMDLPLKYNTIIGQEGQNLSQGQKQRILIARAVYKDPDFIFFDEATNSLDANNEKIIVENLQNFYNGKTVIIVAHRLSTVKNADQIVVLDNGKIIEIGNHKELIKKKGYYFQLVKNQLELGN